MGKGRVLVTLAVAEESIQRRAVLYDKEGDAHFDAISAFIKSLPGQRSGRGALLARAHGATPGEDPRFLLRRLIILASEDVGLADPDCLVRRGLRRRPSTGSACPRGATPWPRPRWYLANGP
jgi:putative ATPase